MHIKQNLDSADPAAELPKCMYECMDGHCRVGGNFAGKGKTINSRV